VSSAFRESRPALEQVREGERVLIVRLRSMGDCVLTTPAIEILKRARPDVEIGVVVEERFAGVFEGNPDVSAILPPAAAALLRWRPALALNLHGGSRSMALTLASLARLRAGFAHHRGAALYNAPIPRAQEIFGVERSVHTAEHLASAMFFLGCPVAEIPRARVFARSSEAERPYAVVHPTSAAPYKTWPAERFLAVADHLAERLNLEPVFIGAAKEDMAPFAGRRVLQGAPLDRVKSLIAGASLFAGNDSGPAHLAAALRVPLVVLFGRAEHAVTWAPWRAEPSRSLVSEAGIGAIGTGEVIEAVRQVWAAR
jgi:ADP-heptose:LPS heptosyltransferase